MLRCAAPFNGYHRYFDTCWWRRTMAFSAALSRHLWSTRKILVSIPPELYTLGGSSEQAELGVSFVATLLLPGFCFSLRYQSLRIQESNGYHYCMEQKQALKHLFPVRSVEFLQTLGGKK